MEEILRVENLTHTYGEGTPFRRSAVKNMDLTIYRGEFLGLIGHTGSGKSTLIQHLNGLLKPTSGTVALDGEDIWSSKKLTRQCRFKVGLVFQYPEYQLFEETVYKDIAFGPTNMGLSKDEIDRRQHNREKVDVNKLQASREAAAAAAEAAAKIEEEQRLAEEKAKAEAAAKVKQAEAARPKTYVVQEGDTLYKIAIKFYNRTSAWREIQNANKTAISMDGRVKAGQKIVLP